MAFTYSTQAIVSFKNLSGKSNTDSINKGVNNESEGIFFNIGANEVWTSQISITPSNSVNDGISIFVTADLVLDNTSNGYAYFAQWPSTPPSGIDPTTLSSYSYGSGLLTGINIGDRVRDSIAPSYGFLYEAKPYSSGPTLIPPGDPRDWIFQYNSGVFFQQDIVGPSPEFIDLYVYTGNTLMEQQEVLASNIRVSVSGIDNYSGSATPSISVYSSNDIYLVDFSDTNTGTTSSTLEIDGLGSYEIIRFDENGPLGLTGGSEIIVGQIYYVLWDGSNFQLYDYNPISSSPLTYTNPAPVPTTIGGIGSGMTFSDTTMKQMWDLLLYPYQQPNFTSFNFNYGVTPREVGDNINAGTYSFTWATSFPMNIQPNTIGIKDVTTNTILLSGGVNDGSQVILLGTVSKTNPATHTWRISASRTNGTVILSNRVVTWYWRKFYGTQSSATMSAAEVQGLTSSVISPSRLGTYNFGSSSYKYFAWPTSFGSPLLFRDFNTNLAIAMAGVAEGFTHSAGSYFGQIVPITNIYGVTTNYYVFRSKNILGGSISIVVT